MLNVKLNVNLLVKKSKQCEYVIVFIDTYN